MKATTVFVWIIGLALLTSTQIATAGPKTLQQHVPAAVARLRPVSRLDARQTMRLAIGIPLPDQDKLTAFIESLQDPTSPNYHQFLTPAEFTEKFGPTKDDYEKVKNFAKAHHLHVTHLHGNRLVLDVEGSAGDVEQAFGIKLHIYNHPKEARTFFAPDTEPSVDASIPVLHVSGLNNYSLPHPKYHTQGTITPAATPHTGSGPGGSYWANDFRKAYVPGTTLTGAGQSVALLQFDGFWPTDISAYENQAGLPHVPLTVVPVDGGVSTPSDGNGEVCLDIEMTVAMAPGLSRIYVYEAPNPSPWPDLLSQMANDNLAKQLSCSWGGGSPDPSSEQIFKQMAAQGQTFFNASGDNDAFTGAIDFPSESTNIVQVGGTTLTTTSSGAYVSESVWNWGGGTGSSGGVSDTYTLPAYQQGIGMTKNGGSTSFRNIPDVALTGDNVYVTYDHGSSDVFGGTSCAAPLWAGLTALINQQAAANSHSPVGFINPAIYTLGKGANYTSAFHDVTTGNNTSSSSPNAFYAVPGYDLCTGWGSPNGSAFIDAMAGPVDVLKISPAAGFTANGGVGGPFDVTNITFVVTNSGNTTVNWQAYNSASWLSISTAAGTLAGATASGVDASLNSIAYTLAVGAYTATVGFTNKNNGIGQTRDFTLNVLGAPVITLQPESQTANQSDVVTFSASAQGLPTLHYQWTYNNGTISGETGTSLTLNNAMPSDSGTYNVVVANSTGTATSSNAVLIVYGLPPNDDCAHAIAISGENYTNVQSTLLATTAGDVHPTCVPDFGNAVWYSWTAPSDGFVTVDTIGSGFDTVLSVYSGSCGALTPIDCDDDGGGNLASQLSHFVNAGVTYYYEVGGYAGATGQLVFHFTVARTLAIDAQPIDRPTAFGANATFNVVASGGTAPFRYQWFSTRNNGLTGTRLANQTNDTFFLRRATTTQPPGYYVVVSDSFNPPNIVTSTTAKVVLYTAPHFVVQPANLTRIAGNNVSFRAVAAGTAPLTYQWNQEGAPIIGATSITLTRTNVQATDIGHFQCVVTGAYGSTGMTALMRGNLSVLPDTDFPAVGIFRPARGSWLTVGIVVPGETNVAPQLDVSGRAYDRGLITNVTLIRTFPTNAFLTNIAALSGTTPNSKTWITRITLVPGVNTFVATATDSAGNKTQSLPANYVLKSH
ncbi:MAG: protease pro-enzyme activation domain-containing protein [Limisphaerales bacterium]